MPSKPSEPTAYERLVQLIDKAENVDALRQLYGSETFLTLINEIDQNKELLLAEFANQRFKQMSRPDVEWDKLSDLNGKMLTIDRIVFSDKPDKFSKSRYVCSGKDEDGNAVLFSVADNIGPYKFFENRGLGDPAKLPFKIRFMKADHPTDSSRTVWQCYMPHEKKTDVPWRRK